jgi:hypothetical protein
VGAAPQIDGTLRNQLLEYTDALRQFGDIPIEDAGYWVLFGQAAQLVGHVGVAEDAFLRGLGAPLGHPEGRGPAEILTGPALAGAARAVWMRFEISGDPGVHRPGLLDHSLMDLDLFRIHVLDHALSGVAAPVLKAWSVDPADVAQLHRWAASAREVLVRRGLVVAK